MSIIFIIGLTITVISSIGYLLGNKFELLHIKLITISVVLILGIGLLFFLDPWFKQLEGSKLPPISEFTTNSSSTKDFCIVCADEWDTTSKGYENLTSICKDKFLPQELLACKRMVMK